MRRHLPWLVAVLLFCGFLVVTGHAQPADPKDAQIAVLEAEKASLQARVQELQLRLAYMEQWAMPELPKALQARLQADQAVETARKKAETPPPAPPKK